MSKMAKFLAAKKKTGVKASVDLSSVLAPVEASVAADSSGGAKAVATEDWSADSDNDPITEHLVVQGQLHLITEEDVSRKQQRKARKWGEVSQEKEVKEVEEKPAVEEEIPEKPKVEPAMEIYVARKHRMKPIHHPLDLKDEFSYPDIGGQAAKPAASSSGGSALKKKEKKVEVAEAAAAAEARDEAGESEPAERSEVGTLMLIEEFLLDISKPKISMVYDDEASRAKFIGRKKKPRIAIAATEL